MGGGIDGRIGGGIGDGRGGGALNRSCNELGSRRLLGRRGFQDTSVAGGRTIEGL